MLNSPEPEAHDKVSDARSNWNLEVDFYGGRKTGVPGEKPSKHRREPTNLMLLGCVEKMS